MNKQQAIFIKKTFSGKKVFLTGHTGFKGSWLLTWLSMLGAVVKGYALQPEGEQALYNLIKGDVLCNSLIADIRNDGLLKKELLSFGPDFVFHLAAQPLVRRSYQDPIETYNTNVMGTVNLLQALIDLPNPCVIVIITTDKVYLNREWEHPYREVDRLGGYDPYSASKAACEIVVSSYVNSFFNDIEYSSHRKAIATARAGNVIGGGDWAEDRIIPDLIRSVKSNSVLKVRNPDAVRPWQHVIEPLSGYLLLAANMYQSPGEFYGAWNFGPELTDCIPVRSLIESAKLILQDIKWEAAAQLNQPHEAGLLKLDISKATVNLNWNPKWSAKESIMLTLEWYKRWLGGESSLALVKERIINYMES